MAVDNFLPPQSIEAECSVLGAIFVSNDAIDIVHGYLTTEDFYRESHRKIFAAMAELADKNEPIDLITTTVHLKGKGVLEEIGGGAYLATLVDYVPMAENVAYYCKIVKTKSIERKILANAQETTCMVHRNCDIPEILAHIDQVSMLAIRQSRSEPVSIQDGLREAMRGLEERHENKHKLLGLPYGVDELDQATNGLSKGNLIIIAGRPSMGKTALANNIIESTCNQGSSAMLFSLEMGRSDIVDRMIASQGRVKYHEIRNGNLDDNGWGRVEATASKIHSWRLWIDDTPGSTMRDIAAKAKRRKKEGLDLLVVDYIQLMPLPGKDSRVQELGAISRGLKQLARELDIPVVALSQLSRAVDARPDKRPLMSDLRDSGEIEQDADVILFPFRPTVYCSRCKDKIDAPDHNLEDHLTHAEIIIEKQRNGPRNISIPVAWFGPFQHFAGLKQHARY
jgi:replicative DNA helicase